MALLSEHLARWLRKKKEVLGFTTAVNVAHLVEVWTEVIGELAPAELTMEAVERVERRACEGKSGARGNGHRMYFRQFVKYLLERELIQKDVAVVWKLRPEVKQRRTVRLTAEDVEKIVDASSEEWLKRFVKFAFWTGLREGTIRKLKWAHVGEDGVLRVEPKDIKTRKALNAPLSKEAIRALGVRGEGFLFEKLPTANRVYRSFKEAVRKAGVDPEAKVHDLRASFAMRLMERGASTLMIMQLGGWSSPDTIAKHYLVPLTRDQVDRFVD